MLPERLKEELVREHERLCLAHKQVAALEAQSKAELRAAAPGSVAAKIMQLIDLKSIGVISGQKLVNEVFLPLVRQSAPGGQLLRADRHALRQWREPPRAGHQQGRQQPCPRPRNRA